jgi:hypothetical protein
MGWSKFQSRGDKGKVPSINFVSSSPPQEGFKGESSRTFVESSIPPACKACVQDECECVK